jgi:hypothetical protein
VFDGKENWWSGVNSFTERKKRCVANQAVDILLVARYPAKVAYKISRIISRGFENALNGKW